MACCDLTDHIDDISPLRAATSEGATPIYSQSSAIPECFALDTFTSKGKHKKTNVSLERNAQENRFAFLIQRHIFSSGHKIIILTAQQ